MNLGCTVGELLDRVSSKELSEWRAFYALEPFGDERADHRAALIAMTIANVNRRKGSKRFELADFLLKFGEQEQQTSEGMLKIAEMLNKALGGEDLRGKRGNDRDTTT